MKVISTIFPRIGAWHSTNTVDGINYLSTGAGILPSTVWEIWTKYSLCRTIATLFIPFALPSGGSGFARDVGAPSVGMVGRSCFFLGRWRRRMHPNMNLSDLKWGWLTTFNYHTFGHHCEGVLVKTALLYPIVWIFCLKGLVLYSLTWKDTDQFASNTSKTMAPEKGHKMF